MFPRRNVFFFNEIKYLKNRMTHQMLKRTHKKDEEEIHKTELHTFWKKQFYSQWHLMFEEGEETFYIHTLGVCCIQ
jgi:hypothetical protein